MTRKTAMLIAMMLGACGGGGSNDMQSYHIPDLGHPESPDMVCVPQCQGKSCGNDGCGGTCGTCPNGESCNAGTCQRICQPVGSTCTSNLDCCDSNATCVDFGSGGVCTDSCTANSQCGGGCCHTTNAGNQVCAPPAFCAPQALGAECTTNGECASGYCTSNNGSTPGWCSEGCTHDYNCPSSPINMWCGLSQAGYNLCWVACASNADCTQYGAGATCQHVTTVDSRSEWICAF
jgi:hypothetical protein